MTPEEARRAASSNNRNFMYNMLMQMQRIKLDDRNLEALEEMDVAHEDLVSQHSDSPNEQQCQSS